MHPLGQIIDHNERREFQARGAEHPHGILHVKGAPVFDEDSDANVIKFIDKYITCSILDKEKFPKLHKLVTTVQTHGHSQTCRKKKGVKCRFNFPQTKLSLLGNQNVIQLLQKQREKLLTLFLQIFPNEMIFLEFH